MTPQGMVWFWPGRWRCVLPGNVRYRMHAMGWGELFFTALLGILATPMLSLAQTGEGAGGFIKAAIGSIEESPPTVSMNGDTITLQYAAPRY